ncbi:glycosyltransferase family 39 protein [Endothiovibrio diazotrophicus]
MDRPPKASAPPYALLLLFFATLTLYNANRDLLPFSDTAGNVYLTRHLLHGEGVTFTPRSMPEAFTRQALASDPAHTVLKPAYWATETTTPGVFVNTFGVGSSLLALPLFALAEPLLDLSDPLTLFTYAKLVASLLVAASVCFVFLSARRLSNDRKALISATVYALGTGAWSLSSQGLWQQTPTLFLYSLALWLFLSWRERGEWRWVVLLSVVLSLAVWCRPSAVFAAAWLAVYFTFAQRRALLPYLAAATPFAALLLLYNQHHFGSPFATAQAIASRAIAGDLTGSPALFPTPLLEGASGLLFSPSHGLLVYSPVLVLGFVGLAVATRPFLQSVWPWLAASATLWLVAAKWFDWWGGLSYGCRPLVDTLPFLSILLLPFLDWRRLARGRATAYAIALLIPSAFIQAIGAFFFTPSWDIRPIYEIHHRTTPPAYAFNRRELAGYLRGHPDAVGYQAIAEPRLDLYRKRLWSWNDNPIYYFLRHAEDSRALRHAMTLRAHPGE